MTLASSRPRPDGPLRAVLIGMGARGEAWLPVLTGREAEAMGLTLVAVCDLDPERALAALARARRILPVAFDLEQAIALRPDAVIDCTTPNARLAIAREALRAGAHVLCEPPLALDEETAIALVGAAARAPGRLMVAHEPRHRTGLGQLGALVQAGRLGQPRTLRAEIHADQGITGDGRVHAMLRGPALHAFDAARAILGCDALEARCVERPARRPGTEVHALFEMADGSIFAFYGNLAEAGPPTSGRGAWRLVLEGGAASWDGESHAQAWAAGNGRPVPLPLPEPRPPGLLADLLTFVEAIRSGHPPASGPRSAAASLAMVLAAIRSAESGGRPEPVRPLGLTSDASSARPSRIAVSPEAP